MIQCGQDGSITEFDIDPADANVDSDGDGFVNKCENKWNTHLKDPTSFPSQSAISFN